MKKRFNGREWRANIWRWIRRRGRWLPKSALEAFHTFYDNDLFTSAAAMSYFILLTLFPLLLALLVLSNRLTVVNELVNRFVLGFPGSSDFLTTTVKSLNTLGRGSLLSCVGVALWAGSWVFSVLERAINRVWKMTPRGFWHGRSLTLVMFAGIGVLLVVSVFLTSVFVTLRQVAERLPLGVLQRYPIFGVIGDAFWQTTYALASVTLTITLFTLIYRLLPSGRVNWRVILPGAIVAGVLWEGAKYLFAWSLQYFHYDEIYGSVGAVVAVLTWSYVSSIILLYGVQLSATLDEYIVHEKGEEMSAELLTPANDVQI